jgi:hypothetical protein
LEILDESVGKTIDLEVERCGDTVKVILEVLKSIIPDYFLEDAFIAESILG